MPIVGKLTPKQIKFCYAYLLNGQNAHRAALEAGDSPGSARSNSHKYMKNTLIKAFIEKEMKMVEEELGADFNWKIKKLRHLVELCIPDNSQHHSQAHPTGGIGAIAELNKMQGHHAAEKYKVAVKEDKDIDEGNEITKEILKKNERDY